MDCVHSSDPAPSIQMKMTPKGDSGTTKWKGPEATNDF